MNQKENSTIIHDDSLNNVDSRFGFPLDSMLSNTNAIGSQREIETAPNRIANES